MGAADGPSQQQKFRYGTTFLLGTGYFSVAVAAAIYNSFVPLFLKHYILSSAIIGAIISFRTFAGIVLNLYFSARSDRTVTRFGRRMPYILIGMPIAGLLFALFPWQLGAVFLIVVDILYAFASNIFYAPTIALMPDITPPESRSKANGIINLMGGVGALIMYFLGAKLFGMNRHLPFALVAVLLFVVPLVLWRSVREPDRPAASESVALVHLWHAATDVFRSPDRTGRSLMAAVFLWSIAESSVQTFFTTYVVYYLHLPTSAGTISIGLFSLAFMVFAFPAGMIATRMGRKRSITVGLAAFAAVLLSYTVIHNLAAMRALILVGGIAWALINVNGYPWMTNLAAGRSVGAYTGLYMLSSGIAGVVGQPFIGFLMDRFGYPALFAGTGIAVALAFVIILFARSDKPLAAANDAAAKA